MPLFMDFHKIEPHPFTEEDAYKAHLRDVAIQNKHGIVYKKYYLNLAQKAAFCLMEGPDKSACRESHLEAQGVGACNIIEVSNEQEFLPFLGEGSQNEKDMALTSFGEIDSGYRTILNVDFVDLGGESLGYPEITELINMHHGKIINQPNGSIMSSFIRASDAIDTSMKIRSLFESSKHLEFELALSTGKPVDETGSSLFEETKKSVRVLSFFSIDKSILIDSATYNSAAQYSKDVILDASYLKVIDDSKYKQIRKLGKLLQQHYCDTQFNSEYYAQVLGLSKTQFFRRIKLLTGLTPNRLLSEIRLKMALIAIKQGHKSIAEIAYESGFSSPTYFTRVFKERYKILPSSLNKSICN